MALINVSNLQAIADRIAKRFYFMDVAAVSGSPAPSGDFYDYCHVDSAGGDPIVEIPTLTLAKSSDDAWTPDTSVISGIADGFISSISTSFGVIGGITTHFSRGGLTGGWAQYLDLNALRVSEYFRRVYTRVGGGGSLRGRNVFYDGLLPFVFGSVRVADSGTGLVEFTHVGSLGNPANTADGTNFAGTQLKVLVIDHAIGGTNVDVDITAKKEDLTNEVISVTIPSGSLTGATVDVGTSTNRYVDVVSVALGANKGTDDDRFQVINKVERQVAL
jgi:hypothetical protein